MWEKASAEVPAVREPLERGENSVKRFSSSRILLWMPLGLSVVVLILGICLPFLYGQTHDGRQDLIAIFTFIAILLGFVATSAQLYFSKAELVVDSKWRKDQFLQKQVIQLIHTREWQPFLSMMTRSETYLKLSEDPDSPRKWNKYQPLKSRGKYLRINTLEVGLALLPHDEYSIWKEKYHSVVDDYTLYQEQIQDIFRTVFVQISELAVFVDDKLIDPKLFPESLKWLLGLILFVDFDDMNRPWRRPAKLWLAYVVWTFLIIQEDGCTPRQEFRGLLNLMRSLKNQDLPEEVRKFLASLDSQDWYLREAISEAYSNLFEEWRTKSFVNNNP